MASSLLHRDPAANLAEELSRLYASSSQGIYLYADDRRRSCNQNFAQMLGYSDPEEWKQVETPFPDAFVSPESQEVLIDAFQDAMDHAVGTCVPVSWKKKSGETVDSDVILVPIEHQGERIALHFVDLAE